MFTILQAQINACVKIIPVLESATMTGYVTTQEAAKLLNVSDSRVRQFIMLGEIESQKLGASVSIIRISEVTRLKKLRAAKKAKRTPTNGNGRTKTVR
jgi:excisionase family DNA binding protein